MAALAVASNELRAVYRAKYEDRVTRMAGRRISGDLLFVTTSSAFGRSSIYNRLTYEGTPVFERIGYSSGYGSFHIPEPLYLRLMALLERRGIDVRRGYGSGPSRRLKLIKRAARELGLGEIHNHGIQRELFLIRHARNIEDVITKRETPVFRDAPLDALAAYWRCRWAVPRSQRRSDWRTFDPQAFLAELDHTLASDRQPPAAPAPT